MSKPLILPHKTPGTAVKEAIEEIRYESSSDQNGLLTTFPSLNIAMAKYFRFNTVNLFAGLSGHGKSYFLNTLTECFLDYHKGGLNENVKFIPIVLHFCFEMSAHNEILRSCASDLGVSYSYLLSSQYDKNTQTYNVLSEEDFIRVENYMNYYSNKSILFFETAGNCQMIYNTVQHYHNFFKDKAEKDALKSGNDPVKYKFIVNIDHTLLIEKEKEKDTLEIMSNMGKVAIAIRKQFGGMVNLLGQLNNKIEDVLRITKPALHYPQKSDIYAQGQLFNACDNVFTINQPQLLNITEYGMRGLNTHNLIHLLKLKARHGNVGSIWFINDLNKGKIVEKPKDVQEQDPSSAYLDENLNDI